MQPKVSVIIASYNHKQYVKKAVESVLGQGINEMEVIVVDDGSSDGTACEVAKIKDRRLNLIRLKENRKGYPRNIGLTRAKGQYIAFQNSDDIWVKGKLEKQLNYLDKNSKIAACFTRVGLINEESQPKNNLLINFLFKVRNKNSNAWLRYFFDNGNCLFISSVLIRRDKIEEAGNFKPNLFRAADLDLWVRLAAIGEFHVITEKLTLMRIIKNKNFSAPSPEAINSSKMELIDVYDNYAVEPILSRLPEIFEDIIPFKEESEIYNLGKLAYYSWELSPSHILFANKIIGEIINDKQKRKELIDYFGAGIIHKYIKKRSEVELNWRKNKLALGVMQKFFRRLWR